MHRILSDEALDILFRAGHSPESWLERPVSDTLLRAVWELARLGPVGGKVLPARIVFLRSAKAKARLLPALPPDGRAAAGNAPVVAILGDGVSRPPETGPTGAEAPTRAAADSSLRPAYLILAARALGLDCRPIWEFDPAMVDRAFFPDDGTVVVFICGLGYGDNTGAEADPPGAVFDETCRFL